MSEKKRTLGFKTKAVEFQEAQEALEKLMSESEANWEEIKEKMLSATEKESLAQKPSELDSSHFWFLASLISILGRDNAELGKHIAKLESRISDLQLKLK